jgi:hypothetical protein
MPRANLFRTYGAEEKKGVRTARAPEKGGRRRRADIPYIQKEERPASEGGPYKGKTESPRAYVARNSLPFYSKCSTL